jgi:hypothetical protein
MASKRKISLDSLSKPGLRQSIAISFTMGSLGLLKTCAQRKPIIITVTSIDYIINTRSSKEHSKVLGLKINKTKK